MKFKALTTNYNNKVVIPGIFWKLRYLASPLYIQITEPLGQAKLKLYLL
mgnify:CR=1 FL=1